jgi:hypothetical protein
MAEMMVNYWAVLAAAAVQMAIGFAWYSKALFADRWIALMGWNVKKMKKPSSGEMGRSVLGGFLGALLMSYVLALVASYWGANTWLLGLHVGLLLWAGFIVTVLIGSVLWERKPAALFFLNVSYWLAVLAASGMIIGGWQ